jgi:hypothetical protein
MLSMGTHLSQDASLYTGRHGDGSPSWSCDLYMMVCDVHYRIPSEEARACGVCCIGQCHMHCGRRRHHC